MAEYLRLPDGSYFELKEGQSPLEGMMAAQQLYPDLFKTEPAKAKPETTGFTAAAAASLERLKGETALTAAKIGLKDPAEAEKEYAEAMRRAEARFTPTQAGWTEAPLQKFKETLGGSVPYMVAPAAAGLAALAAPVSAPVAAGLGLLGAGAVSTGQFTGSNIARQMEAGKSLEEASLGAAVGAAVPQALLDTAAMALMPGIGKLFGSVGTKLTAEQAKAIASQTLGRTLADYAAKTGAAMGREGVTETTQQLLERLQAGLSITDPEARKEYIDSFIGGAALAGAGAPIGRAFERGAAKAQAAQAQRAEAEEAEKAQAQLAAQEEQRLAEERSKPEYLTDLQNRYDALVAKEAELKANTKVKPEGDDPAAKQIAAEQRKVAIQELKDFQSSPEYESVVQERVQAAPLLRKLEAEKKATEATFGKAPVYEAEDMSDIGQATRLKAQLDDLRKQQKGLPPAQQQPLQNRINALEETLYGTPDTPGLVPDAGVYNQAQKQLQTALNTAQKALVDAGTTEQEQGILANIGRLETALKDLQKFKPFVRTTTQMPSVSDLRDQMDRAKEVGDFDAIRALVPKLAEAERQTALPFDTGVPTDTALADEIANAREEAAKRRQTVSDETAALFRMGERGLSDFEVGLRKARLDEAREVMRQASKPAAERLKRARPYRVQPGGKLNMATRASLLVQENEQDWASFDKELKENAFRVSDREELRDQLKKKLKDLEAEYNEVSKYGPSKALDLVQTETAAIEQALAQVERKLKIGRDKAVREPDVDTQLVQASDARVSALIDQLLPRATERKAEEKAARPLEGMQPSLFDVEEQQKIAQAALETKLPEKRAVQKAEVAPIEQAADLAERARDLRSRLKSYNEAIQKAGRPSDPEKLARLNDLKDLRDSTLTELDNVQDQYAKLVELQTPAYETKETAPAAADLFGGLEEARAETNSIQRELDVLYKERDELRGELQRRGQAGATPQMQALVEKFSKDTPRLRQLEDQIEATEARLEAASGRKSARFTEFAQAREAERAAEEDRLTRTLPGFERRAGVRPVDPAKLQEAKQRFVALRNVEEELRKARASGDVDPTRYLRQLATQKTEEYEAFLVQSNDPITKTWPLEKQKVFSKRYPKQVEPTARDLEWADDLRKQINYLNNLMKGSKRKSIEAALQDNLQQQDKARDELADLERRQRAYEQQEAVKTGAVPGTAEAERLVAGEGYRTPSGQIRTAPKKLSSWGITQITKKTPPPVAPAKVTATAAMLKQYQKETEAAAQTAAAKKETLERRLARTTKNIERLSNALTQVYPANVEKTTEEQLTNLLTPGFTPDQRASLRDMAQVYSSLKNSVVGNTTADVIARLEAEKTRLLQEQGRFTAVRGGEEKKVKTTVQERVTDLNNLISDLRRQPKSLDPWVAAITSITKELDAKAVSAAQEADFAQKNFDVEDKARAQLQSKIDALNKEPMSSTFGARMSNLEYQYDQQLARLQEAAVELSDKNAAYRLARLEQLNFLKAYGQDLKNTIAAEAATVQELRPQVEEQAKTNKELEGKLKKANQMLAAKRVEEREAAAKPAPTPAYVYSKEERAALQRIREGLGLPGTRFETDTTSTLVTLTRKAIRDTLNLRRAELEKAQAADNVQEVQRLTPIVQRLENDYESVMQLGERVATPVGAGAEDRTVERAEPTPEPGVRLPRRRVGPVARVGTQPPSQLLSGTAESREAISKGNRPMQTGVVRLTASDLNRANANAVSLAVLKQQLDAATGDRKTQLQAAFDAATNGMTKAQIDAQIAEGEGLIKVPGAAAVVAARERLRAANAEVDKAEAELRAAKTPAAKELAQDALDMAKQAQERADYALEAAKSNVAAGVELTDTPKTAAEKAIESALEEAERGIKGTPSTYAQRAAIEDEGSVAAEYNPASERTESNLAVKDALMDGRFVEAVERLAVDSENPLVRETAEDIRRLLLRTKVVMDPYLRHEGQPVPALYTPQDNTVRMRPAGINDEDIIHEAVHAVTLRVLRSPDDALTPQQRNAKRELTAIFKQLEKRRDMKTEYGISDIEEFVSEMQSNREFRAAVDKQPWYKRFWHALTRLWSTKPLPQISAQTSALIKQIYTPSTSLSIGKQAVASRAAVDEVLRGKQMRATQRVDDLAGRLQRQQAEADEEYKKVRQAQARNRAVLADQLKEQADYLQEIADKTAAELANAQTELDLLMGTGGVPSIFRRDTPPASAVVGYEPGKLATLKGNLFGLSGRVQYVDRLAAADEALVKAEGAGKLSSTEAFNAQYFMRMGDKVTQAAGQFVTDGPVRIVADKLGNTTEYRYESVSGANLINVSTQIELAAKAGGMTPTEAETMLTVLIAGQRANAVSNGWERLQAKDPAAAKAEYNAYVNKMNANPKVKSAMEAAMREYKTYNEGLLNFAAQAGYLSKDEVRRLNKMPYVPFYRVEDGNVKLFVLGERPITIGNIKDSPDLQQFLGDEKKIQPILTSAAQNTFMLTRMAMHNKATLETSNALYKAGFVSRIGKGAGPANPNTVHYKVDGEDHFAVIDADTFGIPAELIVRGMEGIKTTIPDIVRMMGIPADILRKFITRSPAYIVRQLVREPMNAFIVSGVDGVPIANALRELAKMRNGASPAEQALMRGLVVSSNIYTGGEADMQKFLNDIAAGRSGWDKFLGKLDAVALKADAATRATIYNDSIKKGFSEAKAQFRAMESANFGRRGLSPSMQVLSTLVPFFNAQVQGLDVLYRSFKGDMPFSEQLEIQRKIVARGSLLFAGALAYAFMMQDDEAYQKAKPEERYSNFFMYIPGVKDPLKLPVPFEVGLLFMGLPQALVDVAMGNTTGKEASKAIGKLLLNSAPGVVPAAPKPILEAFYGETTFGPIESAREKMLEATERFRPGTTELAKTLGSFTGHIGISPLMIEHFVRGYTGGLGVALMSTLNPLLRSAEEGEKMPVGASRQPFIGGLFQPAEGRFLIERAYARMDDVVKAQQTYKDMVSRGQRDRAIAYAKENAALIAGAPMAGAFRQRMGELFAIERKIMANPKLSGAEKEAQVQRLKDIQNKLAVQFYTMAERTTRP